MVQANAGYSVLPWAAAPCCTCCCAAGPLVEAHRYAQPGLAPSLATCPVQRWDCMRSWDF